MIAKIQAFLAAHSTVRSMIRVFFYTFLAAFVPSLLGWLGDIQEWASGDDVTFPSVEPVVKLFVSALVGAFAAILAGIWNSLPKTKAAQYPDAIDVDARG